MMQDNGFHSEGLGERLKMARVAAGLSTREVTGLLVSDCRVSHVMIGKYERGLVTPPLDVLMAIANLYKRPLTWFLSESPRLTGVRYRNAKSKVRQSDRNWFEANAKRWLEAYLRLERKLGLPLKASVRLPAHQRRSDEGGQRGS